MNVAQIDDLKSCAAQLYDSLDEILGKFVHVENALFHHRNERGPVSLTFKKGATLNRLTNQFCYDMRGKKTHLEDSLNIFVETSRSKAAVHPHTKMSTEEQILEHIFALGQLACDINREVDQVKRYLSHFELCCNGCSKKVLPKSVYYATQCCVAIFCEPCRHLLPDTCPCSITAFHQEDLFIKIYLRFDFFNSVICRRCCMGFMLQQNVFLSTSGYMFCKVCFDFITTNKTFPCKYKSEQNARFYKTTFLGFADGVGGGGANDGAGVNKGAIRKINLNAARN